MFLHITFVHWLVIVSCILSVVGSYSYIRDTFTGKAKPNRVSWSMWALAPIIGTFAALSAGADMWATARIFLAGFMPLLVFGASFFNKNSYWKISSFDIMCGACSIAALIAWLFVSSPITAVLLAAIGDGFAALPTILKAWKYPESESGTIFIFSLIGVLLVIPSIPKWNIVNSAFQIYLIAVNLILIFAIYRKRIFQNS